ncbi:MAG: hypothetical protein HYZ35_02510 [Chloroflexi bacterium]|nr:hypothetical protein [Chloroflexota bacterium]MBI3176841.1 hypothetical protein [Chloroflexota bacterium]
MTRYRSSLIPGLVLILIGGWLLAENLHLPLPGMDQMWPAFPLIIGMATFIRYFTEGRRDSGQVFVGVAAALVGAFFFPFTFGRLSWGQMEEYWPVFALIGGVAFLAQWAVAPSRRGLLIPALIGLAVGLAFLPSTLGLLNPAVAKQIRQLWPLALIAGGLMLLLSGFATRDN